MPNIWEFLGLPANHRPKNKIVQLVKHWKEVPESKKQFPYFGQVKKDGVFAALVVHEGKAAIFGRTGAHLSSCETYLDSYECNTWFDGVYLAELCCNLVCSLEELSGVVNPDRVNSLNSNQADIAVEIYLAFHDSISIDSFVVGKHSTDYGSRHRYLKVCLEHTKAADDVLSYVTIHDEESRLEFAAACIAAGEEGAVFKRPDLPWVAGHKGFHQMKEVSQVSYDLICIGYEEGEGKYAGKVANLIFQWRDGKTIKAMLGKGWTHDDAQSMFNIIKVVERGFPSTRDKFKCHTMYPIGKVFKVKGLMDSSKGKIRLPKVAECRIDKFEGDY
ncbi:ATP-dependent DNA ligase [Pantoea phage Nufs112]|nr:ATP-dependent DNA ligase [Pantoea phage Nufs112]